MDGLNKVFVKNIISIILVWIIFIFLGWLIISVYDSEINDNKIYTKYILKSDCNYKLPTNYRLYRDEVTGGYCIGNSTHRLYPYLYITTYTFGLNCGLYGSGSEATIFKDSCEAKGFAKTLFSNSTQYRVLKPVE